MRNNNFMKWPITYHLQYLIIMKKIENLITEVHILILNQNLILLYFQPKT